MLITRFSVLLASCLTVALAPVPGWAQSDLCLEFASGICEGQDLGRCFEHEDNWQLLPEQCAGDIQAQIEMDREFNAQGTGSSVTTGDGAGELLGSYHAFIGTDDLYNSEGRRLTQVWQILRQDRANFHRFGISQTGDQWDPFFEDADNRAAMESMVRSGFIDPEAARIAVEGGAVVHVEIHGRNGRGNEVHVTVSH